MSRARRKPHQLLAESLKAAKLASRDGIVKSESLKRADRERLIKAQCLTEVIRGWYILTSADGGGGSTSWFGGFWAFIKHYLDDRFGESEYCISAESSLSLHAGDTTIPTQVIVLTKKDSNTSVDLIHKTSLFLRTDQKNFPVEIDFYNGVPIMPIAKSLCRVSSSYFRTQAQNIEVILKLGSLSIAEVSRNLLKMEAIAPAERLIGAFLHLKENSKANQIQKDLEAAGYKITPTNPFDSYRPQLIGQKFISPHAGRIKMKWSLMREAIIKMMPTEPGIGGDQSKTIAVIWESYKQDAYHSLSIEGYHVTEELIEKIENGLWDPDNNEIDKKQKDVLAAKGYYNSFQTVTKSIEKILKEENPGQVLENDLQNWYRELFAPMLQANLLAPEKLAGYRNQQVYITGSRHIPPPRNAILDCMEVFFDLLKKEENAFVRAVLGHFIFVFIHPYMDGNGRVGRFIMNLMLASGGFNWTVIRVERRDQYMAALEKASTEEDIVPFATFVLEEMMHWKS
jgi:hypothetical protein